jgi:GTP pyrophosphokinase
MNDFESNLRNLVLAPWILKATALIGVIRDVGGNAFRHQIATMGILLDYRYFNNSVLLKASVIHDLIEDIPTTNISELRALDFEANIVVDLVLEVTRRKDEEKQEYLKRILEQGSLNAKLLKLSDRISNLTDLNSDIYEIEKITEYLNQTETYVLPMAVKVNRNMYRELSDLIAKRRLMVSQKSF